MSAAQFLKGVPVRIEFLDDLGREFALPDMPGKLPLFCFGRGEIRQARALADIEPERGLLEIDIEIELGLLLLHGAPPDRFENSVSLSIGHPTVKAQPPAPNALLQVLYKT